MLLHGERAESLDQLMQRLKKLSTQLFDALPPGKPLSLRQTDDLYGLEGSKNLLIVSSGGIAAYFDNHLCLHFETGDLIGLTDCYQLPSLRIVVEDIAEVVQYDADTLLRYVNTNKERQSIWTSYLVTHLALFQTAFGRLQSTVALPQTGFLNFTDGQTIIQQGDEANEVFTILSGHAEVFVDDTKVGDVKEDEIFGAMAVFTGEKRSATVKAAGECAVLAVPKQDFIVLIHSHPQTTINLIETMARTINSLNGQLTENDAN